MKNIQNKKTSNKKQHFVPQFYLRNFSSDKFNVGVFHLKTCEMKLSPISSTCQESYFYGKDGEFESLLEKIDDNHAKTVKKTIESKSVPKYASNDYIGLLEFLLVLHARTLIERQFVSNMGNAFCEHYLKPVMQSHLRSEGYNQENIERYSVKITNMDVFHKQSILTSMNSIIGIRDLVANIIVNNSTIPFISSDSPVIFNNRIHLDNNFTALFSRGLQIHCPLSPHIYLILYDPAFYSINQANLINLEDINRLNSLQILHSNEIIIVSESTSKQYLNKLYLKYHNLTRQKSAIFQTKKSDWIDENTRSDIDELTVENANYHINFNFLKFNHKIYRTFKREYEKTRKEHINAVFPRDPETVRELERYREMIDQDLKQDDATCTL